MNFSEDFIKSTITVLIVSTIGALSARMFNLNFIAAFLLFIALQYVLFSVVANIINNFNIQKTKQKELDALEKLSTILECAYCSKLNVMTFFPDQNERQEFECDSCKKKNLVNIQFIVARITDPVVVKDLTNIPLLEGKD